MVKILYFVAEDWYFYSHRLPLAKQAQAQGYQVFVVTRAERLLDPLKAEGFQVFSLDMRRGGLNILHELKIIFQLITIYKQVKPQLVHHVALKPVLYGSLAAWLTRVPHVVNALAGLGYVFTSTRALARFLKFPIKLFLKKFLNRLNSRVIVQNPDDANQLKKMGIAEKHIALIRGSGVNLKNFSYSELPTAQPPVVMFVSRLLWSKGLAELLKASELLRAKGLQFCLRIVGSVDSENPDSLTLADVDAWKAKPGIEFLGQRQDIAELWRSAHMAVLPSYREGLPKALLEAAACGRPIVTTSAPGCREIVVDNLNGYQVPVKDSELLAEKLEALILNPDLRQTMGDASYQRVKDYFSEEIIVEQTLALYEEVLHV